MKTTENGSNPAPTNQEIGQMLEEVAELLDAQNANPFRIRSYRKAAETVRGLAKPAAAYLEKEGWHGLQRLPNIGESLAHAIEQILHTGELSLLKRLRGEIAPTRVLATVPGIGPKLADLIHEKLDIETLTELQAATYDGRLDQLPGFGPKRLRGIRESLAGRLRQPPPPPQRVRPVPADQPPVAEILDVDREYRARARGHNLPRIAPRRFNPTHEAWLPVLHTDRGTTHYTALYSNTARAHEFGTIRDWVVIYRDGNNRSGQWTVVTARYGPLQGRRIIRGREAECQAYYQSK